MTQIKENKSEKEKKLFQKLKEKEDQVELQRSELLEKQLELEQALDKFADLYDYAPNAYLTLDEKGNITEINQTGAEMLGVDKRSLLNIPFMYCLSPDEIQNFLSTLREVKHHKVKLSGEFTILFKNKEPIFTHIIFTPVHNYNTNELNIRISIADITEKKKIENALKESEERFRKMAETSPVMIWMSDNDNNLTYANKTKLEFLGKTFDEVEGQNWLDLLHPDDKQQYIKITSEAVKSRSAFSTEIRVKKSGDEYSWVIRSASANILPDGTMIGFIGSELDITERKNLHLLTVNSLREKETLLKEMHHRIKNNLQIISSLLTLALDDANNKKIAAILASSQARIRSIALIHEKLYTSLDLGTINFSEYVKDLASYLFKIFKKKSNCLRFNIEIPDMRLDVNLSVTLGLILNELITNSLKYAFPHNNSGNIFISLSEKDEKLLLLVSDNGVGLPDNFDISKTTSLGLDLVDSLVKQHKGKLEINRNHGTEFKILLEK